MQAFRQKPILRQIQRILEIVALVDMVQLAVSHMFLSMLRYMIVPGGNIYNTNYRDIEMYFGLGLLGLAVIYAILSLCTRATRQRFFSLLKRVLRKETAFAVLFILWIVISCISRKTVVGDASLQSTMNTWILTDTGINLLILFPLPLLLGVRRGKALIECLFHMVALFATIFAVVSLISLFRLKSFTLPSGTAVRVNAVGSFELGCNSNIAASIAFVMIAISVYMIATQKLPLRIVYGIAAVPHLIVMLNTGCRAAQGALVILFFGAALMMVWTGTKKLPWPARMAVSAAAGITAGFIAFMLKYPVQALFEAVTHFSLIHPEAAEKAKSSLLSLSGRERIWHAAWQVITKDFRTFTFGTTNARAIATLKAALGKSKAHAHNQVIQIAMVMGVPAAEAFVVFLCWMANRSMRIGLNLSRRWFKGAYTVPFILLSFLFINIYEPYLVGYFSIMGCVFFLLCGLAAAGYDKRDPSCAAMLRGWLERKRAAKAY